MAADERDGRPYGEWLDGDPETFRAAIRAVVFVRLRGYAEDVVQESIEAGLKASRSFATHDEAVAYTVGIARNVLSDLARELDREVLLADPAEAETSGHDGGIAGVLERDALRRALRGKRLTRDERALLRAKAFGEPRRELAARLHLTPQAVAMRWQRLRRRFGWGDGPRVLVPVLVAGRAVRRPAAPRPWYAALPVLAVSVAALTLQLPVIRAEERDRVRGRDRTPLAMLREPRAEHRAPVSRPGDRTPPSVPGAAAARPAGKPAHVGFGVRASVPGITACVSSERDCAGDRLTILLPPEVTAHTGEPPAVYVQGGNEKVRLCDLPNTSVTRCETASHRDTEGNSS